MPPNFKVVNDEESVTIEATMTKRVYLDLKKMIWARSITGNTVGADYEVPAVMIQSIENGDPDVFIRYKEGR